MQGTLRGLVFMDHGSYGPNVTRQDGSLVRFVSFWDEDSKETFKLTVHPDFDGTLPDRFAYLSEVEVVGDLRQEAGISEGRAFAKGAAVKLKVIAMKNGRPPADSKGS